MKNFIKNFVCMRRWRGYVVVGCVVMLCVVAAAVTVGCSDSSSGGRRGGDNTIRWSQVFEPEVGQELFDIHYNGSMWAAAGTSGHVLTSSDGKIWTARTTPLSANSIGSISTIYDIHYDNDMWIAVGYARSSTPGTAATDRGVVLTSGDGATWAEQTSNTDFALRAVHYGNGRWVAVGNDGAVITSEDGVTWTDRTDSLGGTGTDILLDVHHNGGTDSTSTWVAVGNDGRVITSIGNTNGTIWTAAASVPTRTLNLNAVHYDNSTWVAVGDVSTVITSNDGETWVAAASVPVLSGINAVHYDNSVWVAVGNDGGVITSIDGTTWTTRTSGVSGTRRNIHLRGIHYSGSTWMATGSLGTMIASSDAETWTNQTGNTRGDLFGVHYANGTWVAVGHIKTYGPPRTGTSPTPIFHDVILTSSDGLVWVVRNSRYFDTEDTRLYDVYYGDYGGGSGEWIATGDRFLLTSSDNGETWTRSGVPGRLHAIHYANDTWVAVGRQGATSGSSPPQQSADFIYTNAVSSGSRTSWVMSSDITVDPSFDRATLFPRLHGVHYADSTWVAVGEGGVVLTSTDSATWTAQQSGVYAPDLQSPSLPLRDVHYADGTWVAMGRAGRRGTIITSTDTVTWAPISQRISTYRLNRVHYADGRWIAVGDYDQSVNNGVSESATDPIFISSDGLEWRFSNNSNTSILNDVHYGNGMWVAVGDDGAVLVGTTP